MFNSFDLRYKQPFGAVAAGCTVRLCLFPPEGGTPLLEWYRAGAGMPVTVMPLALQEAGGFAIQWEPKEPGLYFYRFRLGDGTPLCRRCDGSAAFGEGDWWQLTVYAPDYTVPERFAGKVMYQIFPDRFAASGTPKEGVPADRHLHADWCEAPKCAPDADGVFRCDDYFGGDLRGITEKLDALEELGAEVLYLNPIFEAHSNHRYNTADYFKIDPLLGTEQDFITLCEEAHRRGMLVVLDGVFNHTGSDSIYMNREGRYASRGAYGDPQSPYADWYCWKDAAHREYESWWGFLTLPNLNEQSQSYREFLCGENGVLRHWLRLGADGWRLDVVDEIPDFLVREIRTAVKAEKPDALLLGEVWDDASNKIAYGEQRQYLMGKELDSVMNYPLRTALLRFLQSGDGEGFGSSLMTLLENYPRPTRSVLMNLLSSHDVPRAITALGGVPMEQNGREWQREHNTLTVAQYYRGRQLFMLGTMACFALPGCPCIYYGDEAGLVGYADPFNRGTYPWGKEDTGLRECIRQLCRMRREHPALREGEVIPIKFGKNCAAWRRALPEETISFCVNPGDEPLPLPEGIPGELLYVIGHVREGCLGGQSAAIYRIDKKEN